MPGNTSWIPSAIIWGIAGIWLIISVIYYFRKRSSIKQNIEVKSVTGRRESDWERTEHLMWAELQVTNTNPNQELNDVKVDVVKCLTIAKRQNSPNSNDLVIWDFLKLNPFCVYWSERQAQPKQMSLLIPGGATRSALIAFQDNSNGGNFNFNTAFYHWVVDGVKIDIEISSRKSVLWRGAFYI